MSIAIETPRRGRLGALRAFGGSWLFYACVVVLVVFVVVAFAAPLIAPYDPDATDLFDTLGAAEPRALARHGRVGPRHLLPAALRRAAPAWSARCSWW